MDISNVNKKKCTGCSACYNICPTNAITMEYDKEGFIYPLIDTAKCINCSMCYKVCPAENPNKKNVNKESYALMASDEIRKDSSSGGMFTLLAKYILEQKGIVVGAAWNEDISVEHLCITEEKELPALKSSKYIQSEIGQTFKNIKEYLKKGKPVLFSGCPCQVAGLKNYLKEDYENLYTVDLICHGVASKKAFDNYINEKSGNQRIKGVNFRDKSVYKWATSFTLNLENGVIRESYDESKFLNAFKEGLFFRKSCYMCQYAQENREGDITIGDFWGIWNYKAELNDGFGTSLIMVNTEKGEQLFNGICAKYENSIKVVESVPLDFAAKYNGNLRYPAQKHWKRELFLNKLRKENFTQAYQEVNQSMFDVGIVGYWYATNYGSVITYYALYKAIERLGYSPVLIDRPDKEKDPEGLDVFPRRFLESRVSVSKSVKWWELDKIDDMCQTFVIGSDQVWTPDAIRHMGYFFFLSFICDDKKKIAYAPSFGQSTFKALPETIRRVKYFGSKFDKISVREDIGVEMCRNIFELEAERVLDPVFLINVEDYDAIAEDSAKKVTGDYIATYILDPTEDKRNMLLKASEELDLPLVNMLDGRFNTFSKNNAKLNLPNTIENVEPEDWVYYIKNAKYVITDSHHGLAMAIIYNKQFICYANQFRGQSRFTSLLGLLGLMDRMVYSESEMVERNLLSKPIDYHWVNLILKKEKEKSYKWLEDALNIKKKPIPSDYDIAIRTSKDEINKKYQILLKKIEELENKIHKLEEQK